MLNRRQFIKGTGAALVASQVACAVRGVDSADTVYINGDIWTGDITLPRATAMAVKGNQFVAVGEQAVSALTTASTRVVDLQGAFVAPGFIDNHTHFLLGARTLNQVNLRQANSKAAFMQTVKEKAATLAPGEWIEGGNWDEQLWGGELPTKEWLDAVTPHHPVAVARLDLHMLLLNSKALAMAGIDKHTQAPVGGVIIKDHNGNPTGIVKDQAKELVFRVSPKPNLDTNIASFQKGIEHGLSHGVTQCHIKAINWECHDTLMAMRERGIQPNMRFNSYVPIQHWERIYAQIQEMGTGDDYIRWGGLKGLFDGSLGSRTALFHDAYADDPSTHGMTVQDPEQLKQWTQQADKHQLRVSIHAIGDEANDMALDIFAHTIKTNGRINPNRRFTIEHAQHLTQSAIPRFAKLGVIPCVQPYHAIDDGRWAVNRIGTQRLQGTYAFHSLLASGARLSFGSDWPVAPLDPLVGIEAAVLRQTIDGANPQGWLPQQKVSVDTALTAYTVNNAYACGQQDKLGSITPGKLADFVVLAESPYHVEPTAISKIQVQSTVVGGEEKYQKV